MSLFGCEDLVFLLAQGLCPMRENIPTKENFRRKKGGMRYFFRLLKAKLFIIMTAPTPMITVK